MKFARIAVLVVALVAGAIAALLAGRSPAPPPVAVVQKPVETSEVLIASAPIPMGTVLSEQNLAWRSWPKDGAADFITRAGQPQAIAELKGSIARQPFVAAEPIRAQKIIKPDGSGFMSAILPSGMRAIATEISAETGAGGFILPNDRVDVLLTRREAAAGGREEFVSATILNNVRVLAIDQAISEKDGQKVVVGRTATLELLPQQAETLAASRQQGTISLALRSLSDASAPPPQITDTGRAGSMNIVRYGVTTQTTQR